MASRVGVEDDAQFLTGQHLGFIHLKDGTVRPGHQVAGDKRVRAERDSQHPQGAAGTSDQGHLGTGHTRGTLAG